MNIILCQLFVIRIFQKLNGGEGDVIHKSSKIDESTNLTQNFFNKLFTLNLSSKVIHSAAKTSKYSFACLIHTVA